MAYKYNWNMVDILEDRESLMFENKIKIQVDYINRYTHIPPYSRILVNDKNSQEIFEFTQTDTSVLKTFIEETLDDFSKHNNFDFNSLISKVEKFSMINNDKQEQYNNLLEDKLEHSPAEKISIQTGKQIEKIGYVQGVCECVAALGEDHAMGKKLLSEMKVDKEMAKKYAHPETFKALEQGIFAQKYEQKLEQTRSW